MLFSQMSTNKITRASPHHVNINTLKISYNMQIIIKRKKKLTNIQSIPKYLQLKVKHLAMATNSSVP